MNLNSLRYYLNQLVIPSVLVLLGLHSRTQYSLVVLDIKKCHFVKLLMLAKLAYSTNRRRKLETEIRSESPKLTVQNSYHLLKITVKKINLSYPKSVVTHVVTIIVTNVQRYKSRTKQGVHWQL